MPFRHAFCFVFGLVFLTSSVTAADRVVYEGESGPGKGKHILFIASDHEYRGEETCPAIARIMADRYGFKCTVLFGQTKEGLIKQGSSLIPGIEEIDDADMLFLFLRFVAPEDPWMEKFEAYLKRGGPVLGLRTTTHAFNGLKGKYAFFNYSNKDKDFVGGFGRQILGETWNPKLGAGHYGSNHKFATAMNVVPGQESHPVMRGVKDMHAMAGAYSAVPMPNSTILATNQVLQSMEVGAPANQDKAPQPAAWVREYSYKGGPKGRAFCSTQGASEDIVSEGVRRLVINATLWCMGMEDEIKADADVSFVGPYNPSTFSFKASVTDAKPSDIEGWDTPILKP
ncbi:Trehalose utilization [Stieleria bergensis]|uniref:Trehalose utilization n=1 Tax=Stieleria bergensis TaxID=2528025 RepID=A0A517SUF9_9BACT|nr:Trehalose utilization [Planctomycetes bacterium SV_7m_r]